VTRDDDDDDDDDDSSNNTGNKLTFLGMKGTI
jgi:hypothetical protein